MRLSQKVPCNLELELRIFKEDEVHNLTFFLEILFFQDITKCSFYLLGLFLF